MSVQWDDSSIRRKPFVRLKPPGACHQTWVEVNIDLIKSRLENLIVDNFEQVRKLRVVQVGEHDDGC
jgi:hypothetical protein